MRNLLLTLLTSSLLLCSPADAESPLSIKTGGRAPASSLKIKTSRVPTMEIYQKKFVNGKEEFYKLKNIPALNIGEEREVVARELSPLTFPAFKELKLAPISLKPSPPVYTNPIELPLLNVEPLKNITSLESFKKIPDVIPLLQIALPNVKEPKPGISSLMDLKPNDYKLIQALIFLEIHKNYELAMGLFAELLEDPIHRIEALYNYALTAKSLGLHSEFRQYMIQVAQESKDKDWQQKATQSLANHIADLEITDIAFIDPLIQKFNIDISQNDDYLMTRAKYYSEKGELGLVEESLQPIKETSTQYPEALLLVAISNYRKGSVDDALYSLEKLMKVTESDKKAQLRSVGALTLARMQFQKSDYKGSFKSYLLVDKSSPLWLQAMVESAWTQILSEDYEGAAGNMYSLHTDFFKNAFAPESYVVRTVGYLNLCQFGDGAQTLKEMSKKYSPWRKKLEEYAKRNPDSSSFYETVKSWTKNSDFKEVDGLPRSFIVELARHPSFLALQKQINAQEDEISRFNSIALTLIKKERELIAKESEAKHSLALAKESVSEAHSVQIALAGQKILSYQIQLHIAKKARLSIKGLREKALARIEKEKLETRKLASETLKKRFNEMFTGLTKVIDQNEVLSYELYSGAGEHLRFQMAGGEASEKERTELKVEKEKSLNWKFKGEIWEDEVGHYRSSLKNVCPQESNVAGMTER